jgi:spore coat protein U-like protein
MNKLKKLLLISSALLFSTANNTFAGTASGTITASGTVTGTCSVTASNMAFNTLGTAGSTTATSTVTPTCTRGTAWTVTNSANTNKLYLGGSEGTSGGVNGTILFPIALTGAGGEAFTLTNAGTGKLEGTGTGSSQTASPTLTGTVASSTGKTAGSYGGSVTLTITY